jgi:O-antigen biosynthesis protein
VTVPTGRAVSRSPGSIARPLALGKSLYIDDQRFNVRGVTYGTFESRDSSGFPLPDVVEADFAAIAAVGANSIRTYTVPPGWLLQLAQESGLRVLVGLPWEGHVAFLDDRHTVRSIFDRACAAVRACAGDPAVLAYTIGNEIPASIVRWHGRRKIERFLAHLYECVKDEDSEALVTYANYPSTEYLDLPFLELVSFNVFVETASEFEAYAARLQNIAGDRPLLITEIGLDSKRNGLPAQADVLDRQVRAAFSAGCAGVFVFSWTDEWYRGDGPVDDWDFGLVDRDRKAKPAALSVQQAFGEIPFPGDVTWPSVSVIVCVYNGERTLRGCLEGLRALKYPDFEVIVVDDGSTDSSAELTSEFGFRVLRKQKNQGLASARNIGLAAASGEIVAYLDADARPDPHWLSHLAFCFLTSSHSGVGGPNIPPPGDGLVAAAVTNAPGGPIHVLITDEEAEHIPGCNMAFRKSCLDAVGGFDPRFRIAGDDVDICWRMQERGWTLGFSHGAVVWHHRRSTIREYLRQQYEYGKAEALLERKWPAKYNGGGHLTWGGRVYGNGTARRPHSSRWRIYYGIWGMAPFQPADEESPGLIATLPLLPEWYLVLAGLACLAALGAVWRPLLLSLPLLLIALGATILDAALVGARARFPGHGQRSTGALRWLTASLWMFQPPARLLGRVRGGLTPWRKRGGGGLVNPTPRTITLWSERWQEPDRRIRAIESHTRRFSGVRCGSVYDRWDLEVRTSVGGASRLRVAVEEHGRGRQLVRIRLWPKPSRTLVALVLGLLVLGFLATLGHAVVAASVLAGLAVLSAGIVLRGCAAAAGTVAHAIQESAASDDLGHELMRRASDAVAVEPQQVAVSDGALRPGNANGRVSVSRMPTRLRRGAGENVDST